MNKNITIISLNGDDNSGGVERVVFYLKNILSQKYNVNIIKKNGKPGKFDKLIFPLIFSLKLLFKKNTITISNSWQSFLYPVDFSIHHGTTAGYLLNTGTKSGKSSFISWMEKISAKRAKKVIAVSENCKQELIDIYNIPCDKIIVLNNFVDENLFYPENTSLNNKINILFSGRLEERKGLSSLLEFAAFIENSDKYQLKIAVNSNQNCNLFSDFKNTIIEKNLDINGMRSFYNSGDVFYFPTKYEGFSMATLEALSCGIPVVGTGFAIPQEIRHYDFVSIVESNDLNYILSMINNIYNRQKNNKSEIHNKIKNDFGYMQYNQKLFSIINLEVK